MIHAARDRVDLVYVGEMGVRQVYAGTDLVYERPGAYFFLDLKTNNTYSAFIPKGSAEGMLDASGRIFKVVDL